MGMKRSFFMFCGVFLVICCMAGVRFFLREPFKGRGGDLFLHHDGSREKPHSFEKKGCGSIQIKPEKLFKKSGENCSGGDGFDSIAKERRRGALVSAYREKHAQVKRRLESEGFDFEALSASLHVKLKSSEKGKISEEEILSLFPLTIREDFREMMLLLKKIIEAEKT